ncbi:glycerophosphoryl diester phosphodiesterase membrane domain-containing protein [Streptomyces griseoaurantiacus]|uniref:Glycerophosphoryl diester phosphodiesterase membrane domain-containing protein n=1 Tax=Streptomyces griseoaurantiacus TaxID=68213 RepID=A0A7W2DVJ9_9ACTN|nr:glycerophosphoryl diester phosphodiesterase membrane domain-containing protein [Streptomyces griseoaurantiacus]MBA5223547.1 glycerophosphoryl diester phosphodiesterase membrane domain-containing protein [Streptomyces griseoaurantiacus]
MTDTPGWASPGSAPSDEPDTPGGAAQPPEQPSEQPSDRIPDQGDQGGRDGADRAPQSSKWSEEQPPAGQWTAPQPPAAPQAPQAPQAGPGYPGWGTPPPPPTGPGPYGGGPAAPGGWGTPGPTGGPGYGPPGHGDPGYGHPGYGPPGGWGGPWGGPPPAAKPGVIPLRPLGLGEILDGAVATMRTHWRTVLGISLAVAVVTEIVVVLLQGLYLDNTAVLDDPSATPEETLRAAGGSLLNSSVVLLVTAVAAIAATALLTPVMSRSVLGRPVTAGEVARDIRPQLPRLCGLTLLLPLIGAAIIGVGTLPGILVALGGSTAGGAALAALGGMAASVLATWVLVRFSLAPPALALEKQSVRKALGRSAKLVNGSWWRVFGIQLLARVIAGVVGSVIAVPFTVLAGVLTGNGLGNFLDGTADLGWSFLMISGIGGVIGSALTLPLTAGVTSLLYIDLRIRREALDLELARAAGVERPGPGPTPGS